MERLIEKIKNNCRRSYRRTRSNCRKMLLASLVVGITNLSSFLTVAMEKNITSYSNETAATINSMHSVPILYDPGFSLGHMVFYNDSDYIKTAEEVTGFKNHIQK